MERKRGKRKLSREEREAIKNKIRQLLNSGIRTISAIANYVGVSRLTAKNLIDEIEIEDLRRQTPRAVAFKVSEEDSLENKVDSVAQPRASAKVEVPLTGIPSKITLDAEVILYWNYFNGLLEERGQEPISLSDFITEAVKYVFKSKGIKLAFVHE
ncbi:MAG: hypothetical protein ACPLZG_13370 [Thermoproteota archaeon]